MGPGANPVEGPDGGHTRTDVLILQGLDEAFDRGLANGVDPTERLRRCHPDPDGLVMKGLDQDVDGVLGLGPSPSELVCSLNADRFKVSADGEVMCVSYVSSRPDEAREVLPLIGGINPSAQG